MFQRECVVIALCPTSCVQQIFIGQGQKDSPKLPNNTHPPIDVEQRDLSPLIPGLNERKPNISAMLLAAKLIPIFASNCSGR